MYLQKLLGFMCISTCITVYTHLPGDTRYRAHCIASGSIGISLCLPSQQQTNLHGWRFNEPSFVYTSLGSSTPSYLWTSVAQVKLINPAAPVYVIANTASTVLLDTARKCNATVILLDDVFFSSRAAIQNFRSVILDKERQLRTQRVRDGQEEPQHVKQSSDYVQFTRERVLVLHEVASALGLQHVFHLESDVMVYARIEEMMSLMTSCGVSVGIPKIADESSAMSLTYFRSPAALRLLATYFVDALRNASGLLDDMQLSNSFLHHYACADTTAPCDVAALPGVKGYPHTFHSVRQPLGGRCLWVSRDRFVFDAAALGQYLGGTGSRIKRGFLGPSAARPYNRFIARSAVQWRDCPHTALSSPQHSSLQQLSCPYISGVPVANLHIHCKVLAPFGSAQPRHTLPT